MGEPGSVGYLFEKKGYIEVEGSEDEVLLPALDAGAEDVRYNGEGIEVLTAPVDLFAVQRALVAGGLKVTTTELTQMPRTSVAVDAGSAAKVLRLVDALEDLEDVQAVYANYEVSDEVMAAIAAE